jgi:hypothetical protein
MRRASDCNQTADIKHPLSGHTLEPNDTPAETSDGAILKAIIHIGAEKTGTTSIQAFCSANRVLLAKQGIVYPACLGSANHMALAAYALDDDKIDDVRLSRGVTSSGEIACFRKRLMGSLRNEIHGAGDVTTLLMSNEHLQSRLVDQDEVERLRSLIDAFADDIRIVVYLRRQDRVAVSHFSTRLKAGDQTIGPIFPDPGAGGALPAYFDYDRMLRRYEAVFGPENISVQILEPSRLVGGDLLCDFRFRCGIDSSPDYVEPARQNLSLSELGLQFYKRFNAKVPRFVANRVNPYRQGIDDAVSQVSSGDGPHARRADAEAFLHAFEAGNRAINIRYFGDDAHPLFDTDFTRYDAADNDEISSDQIVDLATHLWLERSKEVVELRFENALLRFQLAARDDEETLPALPEPPYDNAFPLHLKLRYLGALLYCLDFQSVVEVSRRLMDGEPRPVLVLAHALALLALGDDAAYANFLTDRAIFPKLMLSVVSLQTAEVATRERRAWMDFFRRGDALQARLYERCLCWLDHEPA